MLNHQPSIINLCAAAPPRQSEFEAAAASLREESQGLREALAAQRGELERYYAGQNARMRKEYEQRLEELKHAQVGWMLGGAGWLRGVE
jgi:hypothetical protein